jgi:hypothetical protein
VVTQPSHEVAHLFWQAAIFAAEIDLAFDFVRAVQYAERTFAENSFGHRRDYSMRFLPFQRHGESEFRHRIGPAVSRDDAITDLAFEQFVAARLVDTNEAIE